MKKILINIYRIYKKIKKRIIWQIDYIVLNNQNKNNLGIEILPKCKKLILIPHADDEWIGCSMNICDNQEVILCNMDMQGNDSKELHSVRLNELKTTAKKFNKKLITISNNKEQQLAEIIEKEKINMVLLPFFIDWHDEHIAVMKYLYEAIKCMQYDNFNIAMYQVSVPIIEKEITHYLPMDKKNFQKKWNYFRETYKTQKAIPCKRFGINEKTNGRYTSAYASEVYSVNTIEQWKQKYKKFKLSNNDKECLNKSLNQLITIRKEAKSIYEKYR